MSVDERLRSAAASLPEPSLDVEQVLSRTVRAGRRRRLIVRAHTVAIAALVAAAVVLLPRIGDAPETRGKIADQPPRDEKRLVTPSPPAPERRIDRGAGPVPRPADAPVASLPAPNEGRSVETVRRSGRLAVTRSEPYAFTHRSVVYVVDPGGGEPSRLVASSRSDETEPDWSPDGERVAFVQRPIRNNSFTGEVLITTASPRESGLQVVKRSTESNPAMNPAWSPDGSRIAFVQQTCNPGADCFGSLGVASSSIRTIRPDGTGETEILASGGVSGSESFWTPTWSPDGSRIAFVRASGDDWDVVVMNADGTGAVSVGAETHEYVFDTAWSPDGNFIAFTSAISHSAVANRAVTVMSADGSNPVRIAQGSDPAWSADGTIGFVAGESVWTTDRRGSVLRRLTDGWAPAFG